MIRKTSLIIWDEIMMSHVHQVDCVDCSLHDIMKINKPFGGITVVFGGDPQQILPVFVMVIAVKLSKHAYMLLLLGANSTTELNNKYETETDEVVFAKYLLQLGNGTTPMQLEIGEDMVKIPHNTSFLNR